MGCFLEKIVQNVGIGAAVQSFRFIFTHLTLFLRLAVSWAAVIMAIIIAYVLIASPAGPNAGFGMQLYSVIGGGMQSGGRLISLLPNVIGNLAIAVAWIRFMLLDEVPSNPFTLRAEMGSYFGRSLQIGLLAVAAALPGVIVGVIAARPLSGASPALGGILMVVGVVAAIACGALVFARLQPVLAAAAIGEDLGAGDAFALTKGHTLSLIGGLFIVYVGPFFLYFVAMFLFGLLIAAGLQTVGALAAEITEDTFTFISAGILAGFAGQVLAMLDPQSRSESISKHFE